MSEEPPPRDRLAADDREPSPGSGLSVTLWVIATMIALLELVWWWAERIYAV